MLKRLALVSATLLLLVIGLGTTFAQTPTGQSSSVTQTSKGDKEAISKACSEQQMPRVCTARPEKSFDPSANEPRAKQCSKLRLLDGAGGMVGGGPAVSPRTPASRQR
jgi:hypothetical protein